MEWRCPHIMSSFEPEKVSVFVTPCDKGKGVKRCLDVTKLLNFFQRDKINVCLELQVSLQSHLKCFGLHNQYRCSSLHRTFAKT